MESNIKSDEGFLVIDVQRDPPSYNFFASEEEAKQSAQQALKGDPLRSNPVYVVAATQYKKEIA